MNHLRNDIRYAVRRLRKLPGFTITAVLTLALGIGALTTVATWTNSVLFNPWPHVASPRSVHFIDATVRGGDGYSLGYDQYRFLREQKRSYEDAAAFMLATVDLTAPGMQPQALTAGTVSSNYFQFLGLSPQVGGFFHPAIDDRAYGADDEVVLSDGLWRSRFAADPNVVGRAVSINRHVFTVAGVAPVDFHGIFGGMAESLWVPLSSTRDLAADSPADPLAHYSLMAAVRLHPGVKEEAASAELHTLARTYAAGQHSGNYNGWDLNLRDSAHFQRGMIGVVGEQLPILAGASLLLMALVCINIVSLLGQNAARRRREVAIRSALGATPGTIARQVLIETGILALAGALVGWMASAGISKSIYVLLPNFGIPMAFNLQADGRILLFVTAVTIVVALGCGMIPMRQSLRVSQQEALHEGGAAVAGKAGRKLGGRILVGLQLGICFVVLVCCGLLTRTALNVVNVNVGFNRANCLTAGLDLSRSGYTKERGMLLQSALLEKLRSSPGVAGATLTSHLPMGDFGSGNTQDLAVPGYVPANKEAMEAVTDFEGPDFFRTMGIALDRGREFGEHDVDGAPLVAVVNETMARHYWPTSDAVGRSVVVNGKPWQIVGVVRDYVYHGPQTGEPDPVLYLPLAQYYESYVFVALRSKTSSAAILPQLRQAVASLDPSLPIESPQTLEEVSGIQYQFSRLPAELLGVYGISSLLVAMMGLYAVMAYSVVERHREFALRMALGSTRAGIFRLVLSGSALIAGLGLITGGLGSIAAVRLLRSILFGVAPFDPLSYFAAAALMVLTIFVAGLSPARRAASIEPMQALRSE
jgi:predicted permease